MVAITIRNVPEDVRNELAARAARSGRSMQEYLLSELCSVARNKTRDEWLEEVRSRVARSTARVSANEIVRAVREDRDDPRR